MSRKNPPVPPPRYSEDSDYVFVEM